MAGRLIDWFIFKLYTEKYHWKWPNICFKSESTNYFQQLNIVFSRSGFGLFKSSQVIFGANLSASESSSWVSIETARQCIWINWLPDKQNHGSSICCLLFLMLNRNPGIQNLAWKTRWWFQRFVIFTPTGGKWSNLNNISQMGWFNHQLEKLQPVFDENTSWPKPFWGVTKQPPKIFSKNRSGGWFQ